MAVEAEARREEGGDIWGEPYAKDPEKSRLDSGINKILVLLN